MKKIIRKAVRGWAPAVAAAAIVLSANLLAYAQGPQIRVHNGWNNSRNDGYNNGNYNNGYSNGYYNNGYNNGDNGYNQASRLGGSIGRVDYRERAFRLYLRNGDSLHVDAHNAAIYINGRRESFSRLPGGGNAMIIGYVDNDKIIASEVRYGADRQGWDRNNNNNGRYGDGDRDDNGNGSGRWNRGHNRD